MKSIKLKLLLAFTAVVLVLNTGISFFTINVVSEQVLRDTSSHLTEMAEQEAKYISARMNAYLEYVGALAQNQVISSAGSTLDQQAAFFEAEAERAGFELFGFADKTGQATILNSGRERNDVADRDFFQQALNGTPASSDLLFSRLDGRPALVFAAPVYRSGAIAGVLYGRADGLLLSEIVSELSYKTTGYAYIINEQGVTVAHKNTDLVLAQDNDIENMKTDPLLTELGELTKKMTTRAVGSGEYTYNGVTKMMGYAPIPNTPWIIAFGVEKSEALSTVQNLQKTLVAMMAAALIAGAVIIYFVSGGIARPIKKVTTVAQEIARGNFDVSLSIKSRDEVGQLAEAFNLTLERLVNYQGYIDEISDALLQIAQGDLQVSLKKEYAGLFQKLKDNLEALTAGLNATLLQVHQASNQVYGGAEQLANGAQALSQGATEQASSIQQLSASLAVMTDQVGQNAENAKQVHDKANMAGNELVQSNAEMQELISAMGDITGKASEISKIIKIIDDIAFQTNILALNAAVEAARAGAAGKGFAVVADEVRSLAAKSAEAARSTSTLIEETIASVHNGASIADKTARSLSQSAEDTMAAVSLVDRIAEASQDQAAAIVQISQGVDQISTVVQHNAATAEESAAASEELSSQSSALRELIARFNLQGGDYRLYLKASESGTDPRRMLTDGR